MFTAELGVVVVATVVEAVGDEVVGDMVGDMVSGQDGMVALVGSVHGPVTAAFAQVVEGPVLPLT